MRPARPRFLLTSGGLLGAAVAGVVFAVRRACRTVTPSDWRIRDMDLLLDLGRLV